MRDRSSLGARAILYKDRWPVKSVPRRAAAHGKLEPALIM